MGKAVTEISKHKMNKDGAAITLTYQQALKPKSVTMELACCNCGLTHTILIIPLKTKVKVSFGGVIVQQRMKAEK